MNLTSSVTTRAETAGGEIIKKQKRLDEKISREGDQ